MHDVKTTVYKQESNTTFMTRYNTMPLYRQTGVGYKFMVSLIRAMIMSQECTRLVPSWI